MFLTPFVRSLVKSRSRDHVFGEGNDYGIPSRLQIISILRLYPPSGDGIRGTHPGAIEAVAPMRGL